jgi:cytosine/adenosine deaminase-related metal-dependent hydrolase
MLLRACIVLLAAAMLAAGGVQRQVALVLTNGTVLTMDGADRVLAPGALAIDGRDIVGVGTPGDIATAYQAAETIDVGGAVVMPGLVNTHTHAPMVLYRGFADDLALMDWLDRYIFPAEAQTVSPAFVRAGTRLAALEMIRSMDHPRQTPMYDPVSHLVYVTRGDDVRTTIVNGRVLMRNGRVLTLDEADVLAEARRLAVEVSAAVGR